MASFGTFRPRDLERKQHLAPALSGFTHAILDGKEVLFATGIYADHDQRTEPVLGSP